MISKVSMNNFRCFEGKHDIDIAPLTILCGKNSSGKTSVLKNILTIKQTVDSREWFPYLKLRGKFVDNGSFKDTLTSSLKADEDFFTIGNEFDIYRFDKNSLKYLEPRQDYSTYKSLLDFFNDQESNIFKYRISIFLTDKQQAKRFNDDENFRAYIGDNHINKFEYKIDAYIDENKISRTSNIVYDRDSCCLSWENLPSTKHSLESNEGISAICSFEGLRITNINFDKESEFILIKQLLVTLTQIIYSQYIGIHYIGPLRSKPERLGAIKGDFSSVGESGEFTSEILAKMKDQKIANNFDFTESKTHEVLYKTVLNHWFDILKIPKLGMAGKDGSIVINIGDKNIKDVGFGVSQILPIVTECVYMYRNETLLIEQPEVHLHPQMELDLADFFINTAKMERNLIIETHSDHIVNRVMHRMMEDDNLQSLIKIYFIDKDEHNKTTCFPVTVDKYKGPTTYFEGFFTQFEKEITEMFEIGLENMNKKEVTK